MLSASNVWAPHLGANAVAGPPLVVLTFYCTMHLLNNHQGIWKKRFITDPGEYMAHPGATQKCPGRETDLELCLYWGLGGAHRVLWVHSLLANFNISTGFKEKQGHTRVTFLGHPGLSKRRISQMGQRVLYLVILLAAVFYSWKSIYQRWMPWKSKP